MRNPSPKKLKAPKCTVQVDFGSHKQVGLAVKYIKSPQKKLFSSLFCNIPRDFLTSAGTTGFCGNSAILGIAEFMGNRYMISTSKLLYAQTLETDSVPAGAAPMYSIMYSKYLSALL